MRHFYYTAIHIALVAILVSCGAPKDAPYDNQRTSDNSYYGTFGDSDDVTVLSLDGSTKNSPEKEQQIQAQKRDEERRLEQKRKELAEARQLREREKEKEREENRRKDRERLFNTDKDVSTTPTVKQSSTTTFSSPNSNYATTGSTTRNNYQHQYSNAIYPTKARLKVVNKADESKLKKYNVVIASILMEEGANKLMEALKNANEPYFVAKSGSYYTFIVGSFDKKEDAVAYRIKILDKYPRKQSEEELFQKYGIIFSDTWLLESI